MKGFKARLEYILKHNQFISGLIRFFASTAIRFIGLFVKIDNKAILFTSLSRKYNDSPKAIYEYLLSKPEFLDYKFYWALEDVENTKLKGKGIIVKADTFKYFITALKCKYWVTSVNVERSLKFKRKKQVYLNTWHGIPIKTVGNEVAGRKDCDFSYVDYFCISGEYEVDLYKKSFNVNESQLLKVGMPRNDVLYRTTNEEVADIKQRLNLPKDKKVILYAPTWRDSRDGGSSYQIKPPIDIEKWQNALSKDYVLLFRIHPYTNKLLGVEFNDFVLDYSLYPNINDILKVADVLISDYSATIFDFAILEKPIICFAYDFESYAKERGFALDYNEQFKDFIVTDENDVINKIINCDYALEQEKVKILKNKYLTYGGEATELCVKALFSKRVKKS